MIFLDFEASGIHGFPIQVGFCIVDASRQTRAAAKLIRNDEWLDDFHRWDWQAEEIHKISRANLMHLGASPAAVMQWLNGELAGTVACADSYLDQLWLRELADAAGIEPLFRVVEIQRAWDGPEIATLADEAEADKVQPSTHRADDDAAHHAARYLLSLVPGVPVHRLYLAGQEIERRPITDAQAPLIQCFPQAEIEFGGVKGDALISITGNDFPAASIPDGHFPRVLRLAFDDVAVNGIAAYVAPSVGDVASVIDFARALPADARIVLHCLHGKSRSVGMALAIFADRTKNARAAVSWLQEMANGKILTLGEAKKFRDVMPNPLIVRHIESLLGMPGQLDAALLAASRDYATWREFWIKKGFVA